MVPWYWPCEALLKRRKIEAYRGSEHGNLSSITLSERASYMRLDATSNEAKSAPGMGHGAIEQISNENGLPGTGTHTPAK